MGDKDSMDLESDLVPSMCPPKAAAIDGDRDPAAGNDKMDQENDDTVAVDGRIKIETPVGIPVRGVANNNVEEDIRVVHPGVELDGEGDVDGDDVDDGDDEEPLSCPSHIELGTHSYLTETSFVWKIRHFSSIEDSIIHSPLYFDMDGNHW
jgi:hypothetical protein